MKHAVIITAYKDYPMLHRLVQRLDPTFFKPFIHVDLRSAAIGPRELADLKSLGCTVSKIYRVRWGSFTHLQAILHLMRDASAVGGFDYFHLISGQDYPVKTVDEFRRQCDGRIFGLCGPLSDEPAFIKDRYELRDPFAPILLSAPLPAMGRLYQAVDRPSRALQRRLGLRRKEFGPYRYLYKGVVWSSFPAWVATRIISDPVAEQFMKAIRTTIVAEEVFFASYFMNTPELREIAVNDDLRYTEWSRRHGATPPAVLDESDANAVLSSRALFARKMNSRTSAALLDQIDARLST